MNKRTRSISLIVTAIMLISLLVAFPAFKSTAADTNYALKSAGASYTIVSVASGSEGDPAWLNANTTDSSFTRLNDGVTNVGETSGASVSYVGTGKTHRVKFDLGGTKSGINKIIIQNAVNNAASGGNRAYDLASLEIRVGDNTSSMTKITASASEADNGSNSSYEITAVFNAVSARYVWVDLTSAKYVMTYDEIQIWAASGVTVPETTQAPSTTAPVIVPVSSGNFALASAGAKYAIASLTNGEEGDAAWLNANTTDSNYTYLNDGKTNLGETNKASVSLMGTGRTHRFKFDLGGIKSNISKIILKNMVNSANVEYNGSNAGNRGYELSQFAVKAGATTGAMSSVTISASEKDNGSAYSYEVTLQFAEIDARYVYIDATSDTEYGYVLTLDEIEIWGGEGTPVTDPKFTLEATAPETAAPGEQIVVEIAAKNITATNGIVGVDFVLAFDAEKVTPLYTTDAQMIANFFKTNPSNRWEDAGCYYNASAAQYNIRFADKDATTAYGIKADNALVFKVAFTVKSTVAEGATIKFTVKDVIGTDPGDASYNGFGDVEATGSVAMVTVSVPVTTTTQTPTPSVLYGDINDDGEVDSADAGSALRYDAGSIDLGEAALLAGDVNGDEEVDSADANLILRYDAGDIDQFPVEA